MAAPSYTTDLTDIDLAQVITNWAESSDGNWDEGGSPTQETDYYIQGGTACISAQISKAGIASLIADYGGSFSIPTDGAVLVWQWFGAPNALQTLANGGQRVIVGDTLGDFYSWDTGGSDVSPNPYGGWKNVAVNPDTETPDDTVGSPTGTWQFVGGAINATVAIGKGNPFAIDAIRFGRCVSRFAGGDGTSGYATWAGFAAVNDLTANRWGLIQAIDGGVLIKGQVLLGYTTVDFRDSNTQVIIADSPKANTNFNFIETLQGTSRIDWTNITFLQLGTKSPCRFTATNNPTLNIIGCSFTDMGDFVFHSNSIISGSTFRRVGLITQDFAEFDECVFDDVTPSSGYSVWMNDPDLITNCTFLSGGTGHALAQFSGGTHALSGNVFTGYGADGTTNAAIYNNSGTTLTLNLSPGDAVPTVRNGASAVTIIRKPVTVKVTAKDAETLAVVQSSRVLLYADTGGDLPSGVSVTIVRSGSTATVTHAAHGLSTGDEISIAGANENEYNGIFSITVLTASTYTYTVTGTPATPATGTITATFVILNALTSAGGIVQDTDFNYTDDQPVVGRVRKGSSAPFYKNAQIVGTITEFGGFDFTAFLVKD